MNLRSLTIATLSITTFIADASLKKPAYPINSLMIERQSKADLHRTLSPLAIREKLFSLFEAARWAPSSYNEQPWRFIYAVHGTPQWEKLFKLLVPFNQKWAANADALILVVSKNSSDGRGKINRTHSFDTGLAVSQLFLQATSMGLVAHGMGGFDYEEARKEFQLPKEYTVEAMIAIGEPAQKENSNKEFAERDGRPAERKPISELIFEGTRIA
jgi:nitroreductase